jgi:hypothetical protein
MVFEFDNSPVKAQTRQAWSIANQAKVSLHSPERTLYRDHLNHHKVPLELKTTGKHFGRLPEELIEHIFRFCDTRTQLILAALNTSWDTLSKASYLWTRVDLSTFGDKVNSKAFKAFTTSRNLVPMSTVDLSGCINLKEADVQQLLTQTSVRALSVLRLAKLSCVTDPLIWCIGSQHAGTITELNLNRAAQLTEAGLCRLFSVAFTALTTLDLSRCKHSVTDAVLQRIALNCPLLTSITLTWCRRVTDAGVTCLAQGCPALRTINLRRCSRVGPGSIRILSRACGKLSSVVLDHCALVDDTALTDLSTLKHLHTVSLVFCTQITNKGMEALARGVCARTLARLSVDYCPSLSEQVLSRFKCPVSRSLCMHSGEDRIRHEMSQAECNH